MPPPPPEGLRPGPIPPWRQLYNYLRAGIEDGTFPPDRRLPSITELSQQWELSRLTVRKALDRLKEDGLTEVSPGLGTFPKPPGQRRLY